jgi:DNA ligase-1
MKLSELAAIYDRVSAAGSDSGRVAILADTFGDADPKTLSAIAHFTLGELADPQFAEALGIGPATIREVLSTLTGREPEEITEEVRRSGDMSLAAEHLAGGDDSLTVSDLWKRVHRAVTRGEERRKLVEYVFTHTTPNGAKYFTRMVLNQMRINVGLGTLIRSIARAFAVEPSAVEWVYVMSNDIGLAATQAKRGAAALSRTTLSIFRPYKFMNAQKVDDPHEIFRRLEGKKIIFEVKYDGARLQIHIRDGDPPEIRLYSRRLNDVTASLPDVVEALRRGWKGGDAIVEGEAVAYDPTLKIKQPFQAVLTRLGRVHGIEESARQTPMILFLFDMLYHEGEDLMSVPQRERRSRLKKLFRSGARLKLTEGIESDSIEEEGAFFTKAIAEGHEGLMAKDPDAVYEPGNRTDLWMKIKPAFETLDVVIVGGIWGSGRRRGTLSSLSIAVRDEDEFRTVGKVGSGFSEETLRDLTARLEPLVITARGHAVQIEPSIVIEVDFQGIQKTAAYTSGFALRIPRFKRVRDDKSINEADTLDRLKRLYQSDKRSR